MAWTTPRTWIAGELVTAALMNAHIRDNLALLVPAYAYGFMDTTTNQTSPDAWKTVLWTASGTTLGVTADGATWRLTPTVAGVYVCGFEFDSNTAQTKSLRILKNGAAIGYGTAAPGNSERCRGNAHAVASFNGSSDYWTAEYKHGSDAQIEVRSSGRWMFRIAG